MFFYILAAESLSKPSSYQLGFEGCEQVTRAQIGDRLERLPEALLNLRMLKIQCVSSQLPYGFKVRLDGHHATLTLGELSPIKDERARYRIAHLKPQALRQLWHARGLIHALALHGALHQRWHLSPLFRGANGWDEDGEQALNQDPWGYSRALGMRSALYDFVTFAEEWLERGPDRVRSPDNRVECQSFMKGRALTRLFEPNKADVPPRECDQFYAWSDSYSSLEVLFTSPTSSVISSFGHLALLLTSAEGDEPEYEDPVFQYVGLLDQRPGHQLKQLLSNEIPMILQPQSLIHFDRHTRYHEGRRLYRYRALLQPQELLWVKARLWEQLRRFESRYSFLTENCAQQLLRLFQSIKPEGSELDQPGPSTSPMGVISVLQAQGLLSRERSVSEPLHVELEALKGEVITAQRSLPDALSPPPPLNPQLTSAAVERWSSWVKRNAAPSAPLPLITYLERLQDYFDLAGWLSPPPPSQLIPVRVTEVLELKRDLFRRERRAEEVLQRLRRWAQEHPLGARPSSAQAEGADRLVALISAQLEASPAELSEELEAADEPELPQPDQGELFELTPPLSWGSDGALTVTGGGAALLDSPYLGLSVALYDERQGLTRSALQSEPRDLQVLELSLERRLSSELGQLILTPINLAKRRGAWGVRRLGLLLNSTVSAAWGPQLGAELGLRAGQSLQLLSWWGGRGDLSLGLLGSASAGWRLRSSASGATFAWLTLPITHSTLLWLKAERELIHSYEPDPRWGGQLTAAWRLADLIGAPLTLFAELKRALAPLHPTAPLITSVGLRLQ